MIDKTLCSVHLHLYYEDVSVYILDRLSKVWKDTIYVSMLKDCDANKKIIAHGQKLFKEVRWVEVPNKGTDQFGFLFSHRMNEEKFKPWTLYIHDKSMDKKDWLDELIDPFVKNEYQTVLRKHMNSKKTGIIATRKRKNKVLDSDELMESTKNIPMPFRGDFIKAIGTLAWLRELQNIFYNKTGVVKEDSLNIEFVAGTVFMIRKSLINGVHSCVHENFFENGYRTDGEVEHAMERFYFYVSKCLNYNNVFI